jgi:gluconolactonase
MNNAVDRRHVLGAVGLGLAGVMLPGALRATEQGSRTLASGLAFPEGIVTTRDGGAIFVEIGEGRVSRVDRMGKLSVVAKTGGGPNGATIGADGAIYIANDGGLSFDRSSGRWMVVGMPADYTGGSIQRIDPRTGAVKTLYTEVGGYRLRGPNDIVCDEWGGLWFSDTGKIMPRSRDNGGLYWAAADGGAIREIAYPLMAPNGVALGPDRRTLYVAIANQRQIVAYTLTGPGMVEMKNGKPAQRMVASIGGDLSFDNMAVEANGNLVVAAVRKGALLVISPVTGEVIESVSVPDPVVTALAFGGPDMRQLFVTLSGRGEIVVIDWPRPGLPPLHRI